MTSTPHVTLVDVKPTSTEQVGVHFPGHPYETLSV